MDARRKEFDATHYKFVRPTLFLDSRGPHALVILASEHKICDAP